MRIDMGLEFRFGQTVQSTKVIGTIIKLKAKENSGMQMAMCLTESGPRTKHMDMAFTLMSTELSMKATGSMTCNTAKEGNCGKTGAAMKVRTTRA